jgi:hypothetical protein
MTLTCAKITIYCVIRRATMDEQAPLLSIICAIIHCVDDKGHVHYLQALCENVPYVIAADEDDARKMGSFAAYDTVLRFREKKHLTRMQCATCNMETRDCRLKSATLGILVPPNQTSAVDVKNRLVVILCVSICMKCDTVRSEHDMSLEELLVSRAPCAYAQRYNVCEACHGIWAKGIRTRCVYCAQERNLMMTRCVI